MNMQAIIDKQKSTIQGYVPAIIHQINVYIAFDNTGTTNDYLSAFCFDTPKKAIDKAKEYYHIYKEGALYAAIPVNGLCELMEDNDNIIWE